MDVNQKLYESHENSKLTIKEMEQYEDHEKNFKFFMIFLFEFLGQTY